MFIFEQLVSHVTVNRSSFEVLIMTTLFYLTFQFENRVISVYVGMNISGANDLTCYYDNSYES
jgi:hypothetical protein